MSRKQRKPIEQSQLPLGAIPDHSRENRLMLAIMALLAVAVMVAAALPSLLAWARSAGWLG